MTEYLEAICSKLVLTFTKLIFIDGVHLCLKLLTSCKVPISVASVLCLDESLGK